MTDPRILAALKAARYFAGKFLIPPVPLLAELDAAIELATEEPAAPLTPRGWIGDRTWKCPECRANGGCPSHGGVR